MILVFFFFWSSLMLGCLPSVETAIFRFVAKFWRRWWSTAVGSSRLRRRRKNKFIRKTGEVEQWLEMMLQFWMQTSQFSITRANRCCCCCCRLSYEFCQNLNQWLHSANATTDRNFVRMHQKHGSLIKNWNKKKKHEAHLTQFSCDLWINCAKKLQQQHRAASTASAQIFNSLFGQFELFTSHPRRSPIIYYRMHYIICVVFGIF